MRRTLTNLKLEKLTRVKTLQLFFKIWSCKDLCTLVCEHLFPQELIKFLLISKLWITQIEYFLEKKEAYLLPRDSLKTRRNRFPNVCQWVKNLFASTKNVFWPDRGSSDLSYGIWAFRLRNSLPMKTAEWLRIAIQNHPTFKGEPGNFVLLEESIKWNTSIKWLQVLLEEKTFPEFCNDETVLNRAIDRFIELPQRINLKKIKLLIKHGAICMHKHLVNASKTNYRQLVEILLKAGCNPFELTETTSGSTCTVMDSPDTSREILTFYREHFIAIADQFQVPFSLELTSYENRSKVVFLFKIQNQPHEIIIPSYLGE